MALDADLLAERRQIRRRLRFWRAAAFVIAIGALLGAGYYAADGGNALEHHRAHVAKMTVSGVITGDEETLRVIHDIEASAASAVLVEIDSPGGTVTGSEALYDALRRLAAKKPTVALVNGLAASGGYIAALGTDRIFVRETSLVGSIGVLFQYPDMVRLLDMIGVKVESIKSSPLKAAPSPVESATPESRAAIAALVEANFEWFKGLVRDRRHFDDAKTALVSDGRVYTGRQGVTLGLADEIGAQDAALEWLSREKGVPAELPVRDWKRHGLAERWGLPGAVAALARGLGFETATNGFEAIARAGQERVLDGFLVLWHPLGP